MTRRFSILLVEDNPAEVLITQRALRESAFQVELTVVRDGQEAMDYLLHQGTFASTPPARSPDLVLLDLNLPRLSGREVMVQIRAAPQLRKLPVVVLTTSGHPQDVEDLYTFGANTFIQKPQDFARFVEVLRVVQTYWLETALLPGSA
jgi:CheY-like chemotaxis protein